jgi:hypothetical protein
MSAMPYSLLPSVTNVTYSAPNRRGESLAAGIPGRVVRIGQRSDRIHQHRLILPKAGRSMPGTKPTAPIAAAALQYGATPHDPLRVRSKTPL